MQELDRCKARKQTEEQLAEIISISQELEIMLHFWRSTVWSGCGWPQPNRKRVRFHTNIPHTHKHKHTHTRTINDSYMFHGRFVAEFWFQFKS